MTKFELVVLGWAIVAVPTLILCSGVDNAWEKFALGACAGALGIGLGFVLAEKFGK